MKLPLLTRPALPVRPLVSATVAQPPPARPMFPRPAPSIPFRVSLTYQEGKEAHDYAREWMRANPDNHFKAALKIVCCLGKAYRLSGPVYTAYAERFKIPGAILAAADFGLAQWAANSRDNFEWLASFLHIIMMEGTGIKTDEKAMSIYFSNAIGSAFDSSLQLRSCPLFQ